MLIRVCGLYQQAIQTLNETISKFDKDGLSQAELDELLRLHNLYTERLKEIDGIIQLIKHEFKINFESETIH